MTLLFHILLLLNQLFIFFMGVGFHARMVKMTWSFFYAIQSNTVVLGILTWISIAALAIYKGMLILAFICWIVSNGRKIRQGLKWNKSYNLWKFTFLLTYLLYHLSLRFVKVDTCKKHTYSYLYTILFMEDFKAMYLYIML